uniref:Odorant-binding protein 57d3 n=1 Tax=Drosophila takahashii TaxID=29030 RepID=B0M2D4_DROTK|nr:odorant-binding protein 57d3 [Drosophila takahashii]
MRRKNHTKTRLIWLLVLFRFQFGYSEFIHPCTNYNAIREEEANGVLTDWPGNLNLAIVNKTHKCYVSCILYYYGVVATSGDVTLDKYYESGIIDQYAFVDTLRLCINECREYSDFCDHTFCMFNCFRHEILIRTKAYK